MKKYLLNIVMVSGLCTIPLYAEPATTEEVATLQKSIDTLSTSVANQQKLVSKLSDDIGKMADRIGTMADRIVTTEDLLAKTLTTLTGNADLTGGSSSNGVALTTPTDGTKLSRTTAPTIKTAPSSTTYLLYASTEPTFSSGNTIILYVDSTTTLASKWKQVVSFYDAKSSANFYIAIKNISSINTISSLSNGVKVSF